jgi:TBC1 domain family member 2
MNDLVTPFYATFLADRVCAGDLQAANEIDTSSIGSGLLDAVESDTYWCLTKLLDGIQDHYTSSQPGLQRMVFLLQAIVQRIDAPLHAHFEKYGLMYVQFAFRWMNCLLLRELSLVIVARLWDTYLSEENGFASFHVYVCAALLVSFSDELRQMNLEEMIVFLQNMPTRDWTTERADSLLSQAFILQSLFDQSPAHLLT